MGVSRLGNAFREVIEATLLVNIGAKLVYHLVYPHQLKQIISTQLQCVSTLCVGQMVPDEGIEPPTNHYEWSVIPFN